MLKNIRGHHFFDDQIDSFSNILDLGSFEGDFARGISQKYKSNIISIEANPNLYRNLQPVENVTFINKAIASENKKIDFFIGDNLEGSSINKKHCNVNEEKVIIEGISLEKLILDNKLKKIDLIKIDIEGAEIDLFRSTSDQRLKNIDQIAVEFHDFIPELNIETEVKKIKMRMKKLGFFCIIFERPNKDVLFVNRAKGIVPYRKLITSLILSNLMSLYRSTRGFLAGKIKMIIVRK
jgi:FkbM family methyltransferase